MAKTKISEWSSTPANNTDIDSINIAEGCAPSGINDAIRELMAQVKDLYSGTTGDAIGVAGGGTGQTSYTNGQLLIGNTTGNTLTKATLTAGSNVTITNGSGAITIAASGASAATPTALGTVYASTSTTSTDIVAFGYRSGGTSTGSYSTAIGYETMLTNSGAFNTAIGYQSLQNPTGGRNVAIGRTVLQANTSGNFNVGIGGANTLGANTTGANNIGVGDSALAGNTTGGTNTAVGVSALQANTTASNNTAVGYQALYANTTAANNVAVGYNSLLANTSGAANVAIGTSALQANTTASNNTTVGWRAGLSNQTGASNTFIGKDAGYSTTGGFNTFIGTGSAGGSGENITTGTKNTILGSYNGNQSYLGDIRTLSNHIVLSDGDGVTGFWINASGRPFLPGLGSDAGTNTVKFNTGTSRLSYDTSSARYKDNIRDSVYGLSHVMQMRSAQFEYKEGGRSDVGLIAEELQPIVPELVGVNKEGQADSVSYDRMVSVLVKAIQELKTEFDAYKSSHP